MCVQRPHAVQPPCDLIDVDANLLQFGGLRPDVGGVDVDNISVYQHLSGVCRKIPCVQQCHLLPDKFPFLRRHGNTQNNFSGSVRHVENGKFNYAMSILKSNNGNPDSCLRYTFAYENAAAGQGRFIHTYKCDGNPLPSFEGEPKLVEIPSDIDEFADLLWKSLNQDNKVSLFVRFIDIETGKYESRIVNKNK